jgi:D-glycero-D-manno-heptose 1,7-bisphosphate phosphatase
MRKIRISLSIDPEVVEQLDREVDGTSISSRSEAVETIIRQHIQDKKVCIILAGGRPESLAYKSTYRPLIPVRGTPLIKTLIDKATAAGYERVLIIGSKEVLSAIFKAVGEGDRHHIEYLEEKKHLGSAKTLQLAKDIVKGTFLFLPCDHYFEIDLQEMERYHLHNRGLCTLAVYAGTKNQWTKSSNVDLQGNLITGYEERPSAAKTTLTSLSIGFAHADLFRTIPSADIPYSLQEDVFPQLAKKGNLVGYMYSGIWRNVHTPKDATHI